MIGQHVQSKGCPGSTTEIQINIIQINIIQINIIQINIIQINIIQINIIQINIIQINIIQLKFVADLHCIVNGIRRLGNSMQTYTRKNTQVVTGLQTSCHKSIHKLLTICVRTACS